MRGFLRIAAVPTVIALLAFEARAGSFFFRTGDPDGLIATASRPASAGKLEVESGDDFVLSSHTNLTSATFTGLLPSGAPLSSIADVRVEIYRVFPNDSDTGRIPAVPTRANSPSDVEFDDRSASAHTLTFTPGIIATSFTANNSVINGIHPLPGVFTGGEGPVTGQEVQFNILFSTPLSLDSGHYFFVPQVLLSSGDFLWLSAPRPIVAPGTPFPPGSNDLQSWIRNEDLAPDWLRIGTDITHQGPFNAAFSLAGTTTPEPGSLTMLAMGATGVMAVARVRRRSRTVVD